jgi:UDP-N-acetyl-D-galactosamine dehydrogenase
VKHEYDLDILTDYPAKCEYETFILAVAHDKFKTIDLKSWKDKGAIIYDVKGIMPKELVTFRL